MIKKRKVVILAAVLLFAVALSIAIPISRMFFRPLSRQEVLNAEHAIQIARTAIIQRYGEAEVEGMVFWVWGELQNYWVVTAGRGWLGFSPEVYVRKSDGMVIMLWSSSMLTRIVQRVLPSPMEINIPPHLR
jgi:branched-subunit amino acid ABC-type transport system permease component